MRTISKFMANKLQKNIVQDYLDIAKTVFDKFGNTAKRLRYEYIDANGILVPEIRDTITLIDAQQREFYVHQFDQFGMGFNFTNSGVKHILCKPEDDIREGDKLFFANMQWVVSRSYDPFMVDNVIIHNSVQIIREYPGAPIEGNAFETS